MSCASCHVRSHRINLVFFSEERHRLEMLKLALKDLPYKVDTSELSQRKTSYTVNSMKTFRESLGHKIALIFVIGYDSLQSLHTWWSWQELFSLVNLAVVGRPGCSQELNSQVRAELESRTCAPAEIKRFAAGKVSILASSETDVSSSSLRKQLAEYGSIDSDLSELIDDAVLSYIETNKLYQN